MLVFVDKTCVLISIAKVQNDYRMSQHLSVPNDPPQTFDNLPNASLLNNSTMWANLQTESRFHFRKTKLTPSDNAY